MSLLVSGAMIIDGIAEKPIEGRSIWIDEGRIRAIGTKNEFEALSFERVVDARGKYVIPGLMNANVHLLCDVRLEILARYIGRYEELIAEAAQVALKNGLTTVFDTWGPRRSLMAVRDRVDRGETIGSRIYCAGNIMGFDGPFSQDFIAKAPEVASAALVNRVNAMWVENVGRHLMWLTAEGVAREARAYVGKGIDFVKYASNDHFPGAFLAFSPRVQQAIVDEAHRFGLTAQAHSMSVEGLRIAIEAGCDLVTHCNITGPVEIPETTLELFLQRRTGAAVFPFMQRRFERIMEQASNVDRASLQASDTNVHNLIRCGAALMLANDGFLATPDIASDPLFNRVALAPGEDNLFDLGTGHFAWLRAMEEKGCAPMSILKAATINVAKAYRKDEQLGSLEPGKIADLILLDRNPLQAAENYRTISMVIKEGAIVDRDALPLAPVLTRVMDPASEEEAAYIPFTGSGRLPMCPTCVHH